MAKAPDTTGETQGAGEGQGEGQEELPLKVIKRYTNRKLYDTVESRYVTLEEIAEMIRTGEDVRIIDNRSKEDLTSVTLAQIIFEQEKKTSRMPLGVLRNIVRHGGESLHDFFEREITPRVASIREGAEMGIGRMFRREKGEFGEGEDGEEMLGEGASGEGAEGEASPERESAAIVELVSHMRDAVDEWQRRIDQRIQSTVRGAAKLPARAINVPLVRKNLSTLRGRIDELDAKLRELEERTRE
jgi:polyhydroxyalkanoate synthesis repressor PhaR